jgi:demethylmenaquinone methyltransferase/2-methoxy-6-polyprenyl-1,4-benzoquinol methylase
MKCLKDSNSRTKFDPLAKNYDLVNRLLSLGQEKKWRKKAREAIYSLPHPEKLKILDLGTGTGEMAAQFKGRENLVVGLDLSEKMLEKGKQKYPQINFIQGDCSLPPFEEEKFDLITMTFSLRNMPDVLACLKQINRLLKKKGQVCLLELMKPPRKIIEMGYFFYLIFVVPLIGFFFSRQLNTYLDLYRTIKKFPSPLRLRQLLREADFEKIKFVPFLLGTVNLILAQKKARGREEK